MLTREQEQALWLFTHPGKRLVIVTPSAAHAKRIMDKAKAAILSNSSDSTKP